MSRPPARARFGTTELPKEQHEALLRAKRLEWTSIGSLSVTVLLVFLVLGNSQAMKVAWIEDMLSLLPPIAFLIAGRFIRRQPDREHPYGFHRSIGVAHLVGAVSLLTMGGILVVDSGINLLQAKHPTIGGVHVVGETIWLGWLMIAVLAVTSIAPAILGRKKMEVAAQLHDKVLYADADMNKADWMTASAAIIGILGISVGLWWADAAAALLISVGILHDGVRNLRAAVAGLTDTRARTYDDRAPHPVGQRVEEFLTGLDWVAAAEIRVRDLGHVFHVEAFVVPHEGALPPLGVLQTAREGCRALDWKIHDMVLIPVEELPGQSGHDGEA
ncbi:cation transporter [Sinomonas mesophila]|uniref:cation transporter n=1 Tax=Sinomonas mesophila TaxID=1531955 RepID=UPI000986CE01|nr:cation transporter [Sinomonas mesophila]